MRCYTILYYTIYYTLLYSTFLYYTIVILYYTILQNPMPMIMAPTLFQTAPRQNTESFTTQILQLFYTHLDADTAKGFIRLRAYICFNFRVLCLGLSGLRTCTLRWALELRIQNDPRPPTLSPVCLQLGPKDFLHPNR